MDRPLPLPPEPVPAPAPPAGYLAVTRTATYGFLAALPLLVLYEVAILLVNVGEAAAVRVGADVWTKNVLALVGVGGWVAVGVGTLLVGAAVLWWERQRRPPLVPRYFGGIVLESLGYAVVLALLVSVTVGAIFGIAGQPVRELGLGAQLALSIGAGLYEELVFRVALVGGLYLLLRRWMPKRVTAYVVAALVGAFLFALVHYVGPFGDPFGPASFTFRFLFGLALNGVFLVRGFAVAAWTHALYDVLVVTGLL